MEISLYGEFFLKFRKISINAFEQEVEIITKGE